jgi:hypothetical protein
MSNYTPSQESKIPFASSDRMILFLIIMKNKNFYFEFLLADYIKIHQPSLTIMKDETVRLSCEIQYGTKVDRKIPTLFWFEDIHNVKYASN